MKNKVDEKTKKQIFKLKPKTSDSGTVKYLGYIENEMNVKDELISKNNIILNIKQNNSVEYEINASYFANVLSYEELIHSNFIPVYFSSILYLSSIVSGRLFEYFVIFEIDDDIKQLDTYKKCINKQLYGKYVLTIVIEEKMFKLFIDHMNEQIENECMLKYIDDFEKVSSDDEKEEILKKVDEEKTKLLEPYKNIINKVDFNICNKEKLCEHINNLLKNKEHTELIKFGLKYKKQERMIKEGIVPEETFNIVKPGWDIKKLSEDMDNLDENIEKIINNKV